MGVAAEAAGAGEEAVADAVVAADAEEEDSSYVLSAAGVGRGTGFPRSVSR